MPFRVLCPRRPARVHPPGNPAPMPVRPATERASLRQVGFFTNPFLLLAIASEIVFLVGLVLLPPLQTLFDTRPLGLSEFALLCTFPFLVWGSDELRRAWIRRRQPAHTHAQQRGAVARRDEEP